MTRRLGIALAVLTAVAVLAIAYALIHDARQDRDAALAREFAAVARVEQIAERQRVIDTVYRVDTIRATQTLTSYVRARETVRTIHDTVPVPRYVVDTLILRADSAIASCQAVVLTCERRVALADSSATARLALARLSMQREANARAARSFKRGIVVGALATAGAVWVARR